MKNKDDISKLIEVAKRRMKSVNITDLNSIIISNEENMQKKEIVSRTNPYTLKKEKVVRSIGIGDRKIGGKPRPNEKFLTKVNGRFHRIEMPEKGSFNASIIRYSIFFMINVLYINYIF